MATAPEIEKPGILHPEDQEVVARKTEVTQELRGLEGYLGGVGGAPRQVVSDNGKTPLLTPTQVQPTTITIPLTEEQIRHGLHHKIIDSVRWLAAWSLRMIKKAALLGIGVVYKK
ncbi:MAG: hypothetical protein HY377_02165 [Candidatus Blackburnbacteria bacterium]|nr:hypothetical protein [Candidatus Blackburnbacteria bacterium]